MGEVLVTAGSQTRIPQAVRRDYLITNDLAPNGLVVPSGLKPTPHDAVLDVGSGYEQQWYRKHRSTGAP